MAKVVTASFEPGDRIADHATPQHATATIGRRCKANLLLRQPSMRGAGALHRRRQRRRLKQHLGKTKLIFSGQADDVRFSSIVLRAAC
jgi:hypothetical protein